MIEPASFEAEVRELHAFFGRWYSGVADRSESSRLDALADTFVMIGPDGRTAGVEEVRAMIRSAYGQRPIDFMIKNITVRRDVPVVTYEEWQTLSGATTGRLSTAVMTLAPHQPNGLQWVHLHETWLPDARP